MEDDIGLAPLDDDVEGEPSDAKKAGSSASIFPGTTEAEKRAEVDDGNRMAELEAAAAAPPLPKKSLVEEEIERLESDPLFGHPMYRPYGQNPVRPQQGAPVWLLLAMGVGALLLITLLIFVLIGGQS